MCRIWTVWINIDSTLLDWDRDPNGNPDPLTIDPLWFIKCGLILYIFCFKENTETNEKENWQNLKGATLEKKEKWFKEQKKEPGK